MPPFILADRAPLMTSAQPAAQRIYERLGFRRIGDWLGYTEADE